MSVREELYIRRSVQYLPGGVIIQGGKIEQSNRIEEEARAQGASVNEVITLGHYCKSDLEGRQLPLLWVCGPTLKSSMLRLARA